MFACFDLFDGLFCYLTLWCCVGLVKLDLLGLFWGGCLFKLVWCLHCLVVVLISASWFLIVYFLVFLGLGVVFFCVLWFWSLIVWVWYKVGFWVWYYRGFVWLLGLPDFWVVCYLVLFSVWCFGFSAFDVFGFEFCVWIWMFWMYLEIRFGYRWFGGFLTFLLRFEWMVLSLVSCLFLLLFV